jgi:hypothetical protein
VVAALATVDHVVAAAARERVVLRATVDVVGDAAADDPVPARTGLALQAPAVPDDDVVAALDLRLADPGRMRAGIGEPTGRVARRDPWPASPGWSETDVRVGSGGKRSGE